MATLGCPLGLTLEPTNRHEGRETTLHRLPLSQVSAENWPYGQGSLDYLIELPVRILSLPMHELGSQCRRAGLWQPVSFYESKFSRVQSLPHRTALVGYFRLRDEALERVLQAPRADDRVRRPVTSDLLLVAVEALNGLSLC